MLAMLDTDDLKTVRELERLRIEATRQNDPDVLAPLFHEQLIYVNSAGEVFDKEGYLRAVRTQSLTYDRDFDVRETEVRVLDDVIVLAGSCSVTHAWTESSRSSISPASECGERIPASGECSPGSHRRAAWLFETRGRLAGRGAGTPRSCFASNGGQGRATARRDLLRRMK